jgi:hypothetical protein
MAVGLFRLSINANDVVDHQLVAVGSRIAGTTAMPQVGYRRGPCGVLVDS